jgi:general stress protein 26
VVGNGKLFSTEDIKQHLTFSLLESVGEDGLQEDLQELEEKWRDRLQSWFPLGLNIREDGPNRLSNT